MLGYKGMYRRYNEDMDFIGYETMQYDGIYVPDTWYLLPNPRPLRLCDNGYHFCNGEHITDVVSYFTDIMRTEEEWQNMYKVPVVTIVETEGKILHENGRSKSCTDCFRIIGEIPGDLYRAFVVEYNMMIDKQLIRKEE